MSWPEDQRPEPGQKWAIIGALAGVAAVIIGTLGYVNDVHIWPFPEPAPSQTPSQTTGPTGGPTTAPPNLAARKKYVAQVSGMCRTAIVKVTALGPLKDAATEGTARLEKTNPIILDLYTRWKSLPIPPGDEAPIRAMLSPFEKMNSHLDWALLQRQNERDASTQTQWDDYRRQENLEWTAIHDADAEMMDAMNTYDAAGLDDCKQLLQF